MAVIVDKTIKELIKNSPPLIENYDIESIEGASYDLKLGKQYTKNGEMLEITAPKIDITLEPGEFALLTSFEKINMPLNLIGHNGLMSKWTRQGLMSLFSPQIDPGFRGRLFVPVYNAGDVNISIPLESKIFTIEFVKTDYDASYGWSDHNGNQNSINLNSNLPKISKPIFKDINQLESKITLLEKDLLNLKENTEKIYSTRIANISIILAIIAILITIIPSIQSIFNPKEVKNDISKVSKEIKNIKEDSTKTNGK